MTPVTSFRGKNVAVFGLGVSGLAAAKALIAGGAGVAVWDDDEVARARAIAEKISVVDFDKVDWRAFDALILTPGAPLTHPAPHWTVPRARAAGVEILGDIELFCREREARAAASPFVAVTGTNGKSTTCALIAHILREAGRDVELGGNFGAPLLSLTPPDDQRIHVVEVSSFQIDLSPSLAPTIGVLLNLAEDHIDRHGSMQQYAAIKERLLARAEVALVGVDDPECHAIGARLIAGASADQKVMPISAQRRLDWGFFVEGEEILHRARGHESVESEVLGVVPTNPALRGAHNLQNAVFAAAVCWELGLDDAEIARGLASFPGLPHRLEEVARGGRVRFVNDSKATNAAAAAKALACYADIFWILGGKAKEGGIEPLRPFFPRVTKAYLIGEASEEFARTLDGYVAYELCGTLAFAVECAARDAGTSAAAEPTVLLAPACASFDQFANFEARGDAFRAAAQSVAASMQGDAS